MCLVDEDDVREIAEKAFGTKGLPVSGHEIRDNGQDRRGYMGDYMTLTVKVRSEERTLRRRFFVKSYKVNENGDDAIEEVGYFRKEVKFYAEVLRDLRKVAGERWEDWCPKYFFAKSRVLVLEDLTVEGFRTADQGTELDSNHLELALRTLSIMHASSMLLEQRKGKTLPSLYPELFEELLYDENKPEAPARKWISWQVQDLLVAIDFLDRYTEDQRKETKDKFVAKVMRIYSLSKPSKKYRNVLTHGDMWRNNLLFKYSQTRATDCRLVDFQFVRYAPPAHDVMHLIHYLTKKDARDKEEVRYLRYYYENLKKRFKEEGKDVREELTWEEFVDSCREYKELAVIQTLLSMHYILGTSSLVHRREIYDDIHSSRRNEYVETFWKSESYADKVKDILHELVDDYIMEKQTASEIVN